MIPILTLQFAGNGRRRERIQVTVYPQGELGFANPDALKSHQSERIIRLLNNALQLVFLNKEGVASNPFSEFDFSGKENDLLSYIARLRSNLVAIAEGIIKQPKYESLDQSMFEWASLVASSSALTFEQIVPLPLFTKLSIAFCGAYRLNETDRIRLLSSLIENESVIENVCRRLCELLAEIGSFDCLLPLAKVSSDYFLGHTARQECSRLLIQLQEQASFYESLAKIVVELQKIRPHEFREMFFAGEIAGIVNALRTIADDGSQCYSPEQQFCAAVLLTRLIGNEADSEMRNVYRRRVPDNLGLRFVLLEELVDWEFYDTLDSKIVCRQIIDCLAFDESEYVRNVVDVLVLRGYQELIETMNPALLCGVDLDALAAEQTKQSEPAAPEFARQFKPCKMIAPPLPKKLQVLECVIGSL